MPTSSNTEDAGKGASGAPSWVSLTIIILLAGALVITLWQSWRKPSPAGKPVITRNAGRGAPFELVISNLVHDRQRLELLEVDLEYWKEHPVERDIISIRKGSLTDRVTRLAPDWVREQVLDLDWNKSKALIITRCRASVEFEVDFQDARQWQIHIDGDTAQIQSPPFIIDEVNVPPETLKGWVVAEDFVISGDKEREQLLKTVRQDLIPHVHSRKFREGYRERCRRNLEVFFGRLFRTLGDARLQGVKHVYVRFTDDPGETAEDFSRFPNPGR